MSNRRTRRRVDMRIVNRCVSHKVGYATKAAALDVAEQMMEQGKVAPGCHITPYVCPECGEWHVANKVIVAVGRRWRRPG